MSSARGFVRYAVYELDRGCRIISQGYAIPSPSGMAHSIAIPGRVPKQAYCVLILGWRGVAECPDGEIEMCAAAE